MAKHQPHVFTFCSVNLVSLQKHNVENNVNNFCLVFTPGDCTEVGSQIQFLKQIMANLGLASMKQVWNNNHCIAHCVLFSSKQHGCQIEKEYILYLL